MTGIVGFGGYIPRLRLQRKAVATANAWFAPNLMGAAKGERSMANWDEDAITMAVEAGRDCLPGADPLVSRKRIDAIYFASTTAPFADRQNAGVAAAALSLQETASSADFGGSQRAATTALLAALNAVKAGSSKSVLVLAAEKRKAKAASSQELSFGDGAAALEIGGDKEIAKLLGHASLTVDFVDHFRGEGEEFDYNWEERWIRDEGYSKIVPRAIKAALADAGIEAAAIDHFVMPCTFAKLDVQIAKQVGISADKVGDNLAATVGDCGSTHPLIMLVRTLEQAKPGQKILLAAFGQGCDVLIFEATEALSGMAKRMGIAGSIARRKEETNYLKFLAFNGLVELEKGMRAEKDNKTAQTTAYRRRDMLFGLTGGKCSKCGTAQFPRSRICVNPNCKAIDTQEPFCFAELPAKVLSWSADFLTYSMDPPQHYGMVTFDEGGRFLSDFTDVDRGSFDSGTAVRMVFRIKDFDDKRGFRRYFWKSRSAADIGFNLAILLTGAAGFIGYHTAEALLARGEEVVGIDNLNDYYDPRLKQARLERLTSKARFRFVRGDIAEDSVFDDLNGIDRIVHLAAQAGVRYSIDNPRAYARSNLLGHLNVLEFARSRGAGLKHLVYASSSSVYGGNDKAPFSESDAVEKPVSLYAATKRADELMSYAYSHLYGMPQTGLRFFTVYGPWGRPDMAYWLFTEAMLKDQPIRVFAGGTLQRDFTYIDDIVTGVLKVLDNPEQGTHRVFNIGNASPVTVNHFIATLEQLTGRTALRVEEPMQPGDVRATHADTSALEKAVGYKPSTKLEDGLARFVDWYTDWNGL